MRASWRTNLLTWFDANKRELPWRKTKDPYAIWVSEIMLQQTQVATVLPYYHRWMARFPTVESLANAEEQDVLSVWQGLGYYRRCRLMQQGARYVAENTMPSSCEQWRSVPGVGRYTAGAISSISLDEHAPLVDGNVERVYARFTGDFSNGKELNDGAWRWATRNLSQERPGDWNQALMELGACICKPANPVCDQCPLRDGCVALKKDQVNALPKKSAKPKIVKLEEIVWIPYHRGSFGLRKNVDGDWWRGMWQFPRMSSGQDESELSAAVGKRTLEHVGTLTYTVTNHRIRMEASLHRSLKKSDELSWFVADELAAIPMPSPDRKALKLALARLESPSLLSEESLSR